MAIRPALRPFNGRAASALVRRPAPWGLAGSRPVLAQAVDPASLGECDRDEICFGGHNYLLDAGWDPPKLDAGIRNSGIRSTDTVSRLKRLKVLQQGAEPLPLEDGAVEYASFVEDWLTTKPITNEIPIPRAVLILCGLFVLVGAYRVATRD